MASCDSSGAGTAASRQLNVEREVFLMEAMSVDQLRKKFLEVFGEPTNSRHKTWLIKRIIWRMQANAEGGLSERALARARELANDADLRVTAPRQLKLAPNAQARTLTVQAKVSPSTELLPGTLLKRQYKGRAICVMVLDNGFEYEGHRYKSLTAVTEAVTGKHWNGFQFFGLRPAGGAQ